MFPRGHSACITTSPFLIGSREIPKCLLGFWKTTSWDVSFSIRAFQPFPKSLCYLPWEMLKYMTQRPVLKRNSKGTTCFIEAGVSALRPFIPPQHLFQPPFKTFQTSLGISGLTKMSTEWMCCLLLDSELADRSISFLHSKRWIKTFVECSVSHWAHTCWIQGLPRFCARLG